eukprot:6187123-Pleurochrysis_carterae.AAC.2
MAYAKGASLHLHELWSFSTQNTLILRWFRCSQDIKRTTLSDMQQVVTVHKAGVLKLIQLHGAKVLCAVQHLLWPGRAAYANARRVNLLVSSRDSGGSQNKKSAIDGPFARSPRPRSFCTRLTAERPNATCVSSSLSGITPDSTGRWRIAFAASMPVTNAFSWLHDP